MVGCEYEPAPEYKLLKVAEIALQGDESELIGQVYDLHASLDGDFYLADKVNHKVWVANQNGEIIGAIGRQGQGPGELSEPVGIAIVGQTLAIAEQGNKRISFFDLGGKYRSSFPIRGGFISGLKWSPSDSLLIVSRSLGVQHFDIYTFEGRRVNANMRPKQTAFVIPFHLPGGHMSLTAAGDILFSSLRSYDVVKMSFSGDTLATYSAKPTGYVPPNVPSREKYMAQTDWSVVGLPLELQDVVLIQRYRRQTSDWKPTEWTFLVDVFTESGELLQAGISSPAALKFAKDGLLYAISIEPIDKGADNPAILVYSLSR